jgi:hypothetical protein
MLRICVTELRGDHAQRDTAHRQYTCWVCRRAWNVAVGSIPARKDACLMGRYCCEGFQAFPSAREKITAVAFRLGAVV